MVPRSGFPLARRASGDSIPWSMAFRMMWTIGSPMCSMTDRSTSVSSPVIFRSTSFPMADAMSRTTLGNFPKTFWSACMRIFITESCRSDVTRSRNDTRLHDVRDGGVVGVLRADGRDEVQQAVPREHHLAREVHHLVDPAHVHPQVRDLVLLLLRPSSPRSFFSPSLAALAGAAAAGGALDADGGGGRSGRRGAAAGAARGRRGRSRGGRRAEAAAGSRRRGRPAAPRSPPRAPRRAPRAGGRCCRPGSPRASRGR